MEFLNQLNPSTRTISANDLFTSVSIIHKAHLYNLTRSELLPNEIPDTMLYIANFNNDNGFVIVSADDRVGGVVAYVEHGTFYPHQMPTNTGFDLFLEGLAEYYQNVINDDSKETSPDNDRIYDPDALLERHYVIDSIHYPLMMTLWGQDYPYNILCPHDSFDNPTKTCCIATATAQIFAYHRSPTSFRGHVFDWDAILEDSVPFWYDTQIMVSQLMVDIGELDSVKYGNEQSTGKSQYLGICLDSMGYHHSPYDSLIIDTCINNIAQNWPVYLRGTDVVRDTDAHAWVSDGYIFRSLHMGMALPGGETQIVQTNHQKLLHCNWGWNGQYNGYFLSSAFAPSSGRKYYSNGTRSRDCNSNYSRPGRLGMYHEIYPLQQ